ncbi:MAG: hypothetical protein GXP55_18535 [Deltaproteobacteria bacterium]|nr:hypothetical protein [Deltaproteobacteria bacterium]
MNSSTCTGDQICIDGTCRARTRVDSGRVEPGCNDRDGDGFGDGCAAGPDCDDGNPTQTGREVCDGADNDCDGVVDNGVVSECGDCNPDCRLEGHGVGTPTPFDPEADPSDGVGLDPTGALILDSRRVNTNIIWIAETWQGTVSKYSTEAPYPELGRYNTGPDGAANDPSRTSVNSLGDVYVGNRGGNSVSRISVLGSDCPDTNGDGVITTSSGSDVLAVGADDCVLWTTDLETAMPGERHVRAVAAQDVDGPDGELLEYVWIGGYDTNRIAKLDGNTGAVLFTTPSVNNPYGFAMDGSGNLWISTRAGNYLGRVDTTRCIDEASCAGAVCQGEGPGFDDCVKQRIPTPMLPYGITVDFNQRVWLGGADVGRYTPTAAPGSRWQTSGLPYGGIAVHGIAADAEGWIWGGAQGNGVVRIEADNPRNYLAVPGTTGMPNKGMAVDADGKIWCIRYNDAATVITPGAAIGDNVVNTGVATYGSGLLRYTYSDMTGLQLRLATNPRGYYRHIYEGCPAGSPTPTDWGEVRWDADTPPGTTVLFRVKTADTRAALDAADWTLVATSPPDASPASIGAALTAAGITPGRLLMLEIVLRAERTSATEVITPVVRSSEVTHSCPPDFG